MADDRHDEYALPIDVTLLHLPSGYGSTGDPVDGNPFAAGTVRYQLWERATRDAEEKIARLKSEWLASHTDLRELSSRTTSEDVEVFNAVYRERRRQLLAFEFEVWAERGAQAICSDADVRALDGWLKDYADACLNTRARHMATFDLSRRTIEAELRWMRELLGSLVLHWKAEARRGCRARQEDAGFDADDAGHDPALQTGEASPKIDGSSDATAETAAAAGGAVPFGTSRMAAVEAYLLLCRQEPGVQRALSKTDYWRAGGYESDRQFQHWQAGQDEKARPPAVNTFNKLLKMPPADFVALLRKKGLL